MSLPVAILAGGLATRLRPVTEKIPKALIEIAGEPFVYHQLRLLVRQDIRRVIFCLGYLGEQVVDAVGDGRSFGLEIDYVFDGPKLLGTGGALVQALPLLGDTFFVLYGDSYLSCSYAPVAAAFRASGCQALMTVMPNDNQWDTSNVEYRNGKIIAYSKANKTSRMRHIDYGLSVVARVALSARPAGVAFDLAEVYEVLALQGGLAGYEVHDRFYEVGSRAGIEDLALYLQSRDADDVRA